MTAACICVYVNVGKRTHVSFKHTCMYAQSVNLLLYLTLMWSQQAFDFCQRDQIAPKENHLGVCI